MCKGSESWVIQHNKGLREQQSTKSPQQSPWQKV